MKISETRAEGLIREYAIVISAAEIDEQVAAKLAELATTVNMPGFRPGKVPMSVVKSRFGPQVQGEAMKNALDEGARQAIENNELRLASQPSVEITSYEDGKDLEAALSCEIMPAITMPDLAKLDIERPTLEAGDAEIDEALKNIADSNRPTVEVTAKRDRKARRCCRDRLHRPHRRRGVRGRRCRWAFPGAWLQQLYPGFRGRPCRREGRRDP